MAERTISALTHKNIPSKLSINVSVGIENPGGAVHGLLSCPDVFSPCHKRSLTNIQKLWYSTVQYSTAQYSTVQHSTAQYSTVQYSTVQLEHKMSAPTIVQKLFKIDKLDPVPAPAPAVKTRPAAAPAPQQLTEPRLALLWPRPRHMTELGGAGLAVGPLLQLVVTQHPHTSVHFKLNPLNRYRKFRT